MIDIVDWFRDYCNNKGWKFSYGRQDYHNLIEDTDLSWHLFLDAVERMRKSFRMEYKVSFSLLSRSDIDLVFDTQKQRPKETGKWEMHIKPKVMFIKNDFEADICDSFEMDEISTIDAINIFDENMDGVVCEAVIIQHLNNK